MKSGTDSTPTGQPRWGPRVARRTENMSLTKSLCCHRLCFSNAQFSEIRSPVKVTAPTGIPTSLAIPFSAVLMAFISAVLCFDLFACQKRKIHTRKARF